MKNRALVHEERTLPSGGKMALRTAMMRGVAFFRKDREAAPSLPVAGFWAWWSRVADSIDPRRPSELTDELTRRVQAIHPDLTWHFGQGVGSDHCLPVSANGVAVVRPAAERWLRAAPAATRTWEFRSSQQADPAVMANVLDIAGHRVDLSRTAFSISRGEGRSRVDVGVFHPAFAQMPPGAAWQVTRLVLDWVVGEDNVERWLGRIEPLRSAPAEPASADALTREVVQLAAARTVDAWALGRWESPDGTTGIALFRPWLRWLDYPTLDRHHLIAVTYDAQANGLPADGAALDALRTVEDGLISTIGSRGVLVGHESSRCVRTFHIYTDSEDAAVGDAINAYVARTGHTTHSSPDPAWREVRHFTG